MPRLLRSPWEDCFDQLVSRARGSLILCSPFIGNGPCRKVQHRSRDWTANFELVLVTDLSRDNMLSGVTDVKAIASVVHSFPATQVRFLPSLHAKVYIADDTEAVVTSANMTYGGLVRNFEYGVHFAERQTVRLIRQDVLDYIALASPIDIRQLETFVQITLELREMHKAAEKSLRGRLRREFDKKLWQADDRIIGVRAAGRTPHAIFAEAIRHLLRFGPASTQVLHRGIQNIHPDLCDDAVDRIVDGKHFGKKWKHAVRTAQQHLKKRGEIRLVNSRWRLADDHSPRSES